MKYSRSVKCYFRTWITDSKQHRIREFLMEMHRVVEWCVEHHEANILGGMKKGELLLADKLHECDSWLTQRAKKNAFAEAYGLILSCKRSSEERKVKYKTPRHNPNRIMLSMTNIVTNDNPELNDFDFFADIVSYDSRIKSNKREDVIKLGIPLKKSTHFNYWAKRGKLCTSAILTHEYIQFTFECKTDKKDEGGIIGIDPGAKHLLTDDEGNHYGSDIWRLLQKLYRKKRLSKAWYRCREEITEYIDRTCKELPYHLLAHIALEDNRKIKNKSKVRGRLTKNMRSVLTGWSISRINDRIQFLCEENGVRLARIPAWYNSTTCPDCGHSEKANRPSQDEFICVGCDVIHNADVVGAMNSLGRFALGKYGSQYKQTFIQKHPQYYALSA
jgi:transposase